MKTALFAALLAAAPILAAALPAPAAPATLTYADLAHRLSDLKRLASPPIPGEHTGSATSTDRASRYDAQTDRYVDWRANDDGTGYVRREGDSVVAADLQGPGVLWRIWSAAPKSGAIKIYVDGAEKPALDVPFSRLFDAVHGPFPYPQLVRTMAGGWNCFVPIPYQKSCKVVLGPDWGAYYQFTYTRFADGTQVPSFTGTLDDGQKAALADADAAWARRGLPVAGPGEAVIRKTVSLAPGQSVVMADLGTPGAITGLVCSVAETESTGMEQALREVAISIAWDGEARPSVWSPLGDFFGSGPGLNPFQALPCGMTGEGMYASWFMPYHKAVLRLSNDGATTRRVSLTILHGPLAQPADSLLRFHVKWHRDHWGGAGVGRYAKDRWPDWPALLAGGGPGRFCGLALHVWNPLHSWDKALAAKYVKHVSEICPDPAWFRANVLPDYWWGEGDEKFFVDGEKYPSTFGTGTEDYFGFAWGTPEVFDSATQCQTRSVGNVGHLSLTRFHVADDVPFQHSFEASLEKYHGNDWPLLYATTVYWYQTPGVTDQYEALPVTQRENYYTLPELAPSPAPPVPTGSFPGAMECETLTITSRSPDLEAGPQDMSLWGRERWSGGRHLVVKARQPGDFIELEVPAADAQPKDLRLYATRAPDFGTLSFQVNGHPSAVLLDGYAESVQPSGPLDLGTFTPQNGRFLLRVQVTGSNPKSTGARHFFGLDCVVPAPAGTPGG